MEWLTELGKVFQSAGLEGLLLFALLVIVFVFLRTLGIERKANNAALAARDDLIKDMVTKLGAVSDKQADGNLRMAIALSRIESRLGIEEQP